MPKRTTPVQRLVKKIYEAMAPAGATITESAEKTERGRAAKREIDILIEQPLYGTTIKIAVEVREHTRKETLLWIDSLVGRFKSMDVHKVIAVSTSGFSRDALIKARDERIDALTIAQAEDLDWPSQFKKVGIAALSRTDKPHSIVLVTDAQDLGPVSMEWMIGSEDEAICTVGDLARKVYEHRQQGISKKLQEIAPTLTLADFQTKTLLTELPVPISENTYLYLPDGRRPRVIQFVVRMTSTWKVDVQEVQRHIFGEQHLAATTTAVVKDPETGTRSSWTLVQTAAEPTQARFSVEPLTDAPATSRKRRKEKKEKK